MRNIPNKISFIYLILALMLLITGCAGSQKAYHQLMMRGSILEVNGDEVYLCIGSKDGAQVNQELDVYNLKKIIRPKGSRWYREKTGKIKITEIVDEHFAKAKIISGEVKINDIAETK